jgi:hypothetical protein
MAALRCGRLVLRQACAAAGLCCGRLVLGQACAAAGLCWGRLVLRQACAVQTSPAVSSSSILPRAYSTRIAEEEARASRLCRARVAWASARPTRHPRSRGQSAATTLHAPVPWRRDTGGATTGRRRCKLDTGQLDAGVSASYTQVYTGTCTGTGCGGRQYHAPRPPAPSIGSRSACSPVPDSLSSSLPPSAPLPSALLSPSLYSGRAHTIARSLVHPPSGSCSHAETPTCGAAAHASIRANAACTDQERRCGVGPAGF